MSIELINSLMGDVLLEAAPRTEVAPSLLVVERQSVASTRADVVPSFMEAAAHLLVRPIYWEHSTSISKA